MSDVLFFRRKKITRESRRFVMCDGALCASAAAAFLAKYLSSLLLLLPPLSADIFPHSISSKWTAQTEREKNDFCSEEKRRENVRRREKKKKC